MEVTTNPTAARERALAAARSGDSAAATRQFAAALAAFPKDAALLNSAGNFHARSGDAAVALDCFERVLRLDPHHGEAAINRAVVLTRLGRAHEATTMLVAGQDRWQDLPRYWTTRGAADIAAGDKAAAARSYDQALRRDPRHARALAGRAQVARDRGEADAVAWYERALTAQPGDAHLLLGAAEALDMGGRAAEAEQIGAMLVAQLPLWLPALEAQATRRFAAGDRDGFCRDYAAAPPAGRTVDFYLSWGTMLAGAGQTDKAAAVIAQARQLFPADPDLALALAGYLDAIGEHGAAADLFARCRRPTTDWRLHEARYLLRIGDPGAADALLATALEESPGDVTGWSLRDVAWRLLGDKRHDWLHVQPGLIATLVLDLSPEEIATAIAVLDTLHDRSGTPIGQSVRAGSQTRGALLERAEPVVARVAAAITDALERYRADLPPVDPTHPLLRHRDAAWSIVGSWSIRMVGQGRHASHIHPHGIISSAAYLVVPEVAGEDRSGWLELGRPPSDLRIDLPALATIEPRPGRLALFPSTLYHGTRPIAGGRRMTIAFDVQARRA